MTIKSRFRFTSGNSEERAWSVYLPCLTNKRKLNQGAQLLQFQQARSVTKRVLEANAATTWQNVP